MHSFIVYPQNLLDRLKRGEGFKQELTNEIERVLETDQEVINLIRGRTILHALQTDQNLKNLIIERTRPKYEELLARGRSGPT